MTTITLQLEGLHCGHCVRSVENALSALATVRAVKVDLTTQTAVVESDETPTTLIEAIVEIGFDAKEA
ncbi:Cation transport ATPase [Bibersteinia trehalosi USDA-ARS-USMARC-188]|uniref:Cation transport ATPase n=2 Tax=Bibersteinia trehalosi TaxID=47735 RepID=A0A4V7I8N7_BIBTR|nr:heavy metal-associated domain-containing protein [Bibersteinia trehalosi]AGH38811.1 Cation transport ATPase [Bibersteinia trehalosi USDA-ARS-USMARC-192]AHG81390.1 Cation transport ATPase [Bibersteinia trehalosi USDA-ARS-USMARC-188]AHG83654.1 Cation transport ATPase [Bibersteinia trehalosi USDA-ARS-USMARC-189]